MQNVYHRIGKTKFRLLVVLVVLMTDFRWSRVLKRIFQNAPELVGNFSPGDQKQILLVLDQSIELGLILVLCFQLFIAVLFLRGRWLSREYFSTHSAISMTLLLWNGFFHPEALALLVAQAFIFYGLFHWKIIFENSAQESSFATAESSQAAEHSHS